MQTTASGKADILVLGIETSCDETAAAVVLRKDLGRVGSAGDGVGAANIGAGRILSNVVRSQIEQHREFGGVVPEIAARAHVECLDSLIAKAMHEAGVTFADLSAIAVTAGPGLIGGLLVGVTSAKAIALVHELPIYGINHLEGHALTVGLTHGIVPPYLLLLVSGGHTQLLAVQGVGRYQRLGTTIDDALGEAFDKTAKLLGLSYPGGPAVEQWSQGGDATRFRLPRPMLGRPEPHFSFAGLKTAVRLKAKDCEPLHDQDIKDLCASFQAAACDAVADRVARAMTLYELQLEGARSGLGADVGDVARSATDPLAGESVSKLVVAGGVAANKALRVTLAALARRHNYQLVAPPVHLCGDNAAMIAWAGAERVALGLATKDDFICRARWPLDPDAAPALGAGIKA